MTDPVPPKTLVEVPPDIMEAWMMLNQWCGEGFQAAYAEHLNRGGVEDARTYLLAQLEQVRRDLLAKINGAPND